MTAAIFLLLAIAIVLLGAVSAPKPVAWVAVVLGTLAILLIVLNMAHVLP